MSEQDLTERYVYGDVIRPDLLAIIPREGRVIGSVGCGTGITEAELVAQGREVHGVDISPQAIELAKTRLTSARVIDPSDRQPFEPRSLDGLILADVLEHMPAAWEVLVAFAKMVKPGGWVLISVPNMRHWQLIYYFLLHKDWPEQPTGIFDSTHLQVMTKKRLERWCRAAGLQVERWFDRYDPVKKFYRVTRPLDLMTLKLFHGWFMFQLQVLCRVPDNASSPSSKTQ